ncbi:uncharacterized protein LOC129243989 [Anastrepha obliqua]|uniref:uncharacterized protein LOC129243989 n=1 Tax=Anastrepha obliqua TaxID=95512 RepID=UPI00240A2D9E|nr:uncharacterized protein LOC129243989 [Anastrepha obliqua]
MNKNTVMSSGVITKTDAERERHTELGANKGSGVDDDQTQQIGTPLLQDTSTIAFLWLVVFSILMFTFPFMTFYGVRSWLRESFDVTDFYVNCWSVLSSVFVVNVIICLYVFKAILEEKNSDPVTERNDKKDD